jgi:hypothetical protein
VGVLCTSGGVVARADVGNLYGPMALFDLQSCLSVVSLHSTPSEYFWGLIFFSMPSPRLRATVAVVNLFQAVTFGSGLVLHVGLSWNCDRMCWSYLISA